MKFCIIYIIYVHSLWWPLYQLIIWHPRFGKSLIFNFYLLFFYMIICMLCSFLSFFICNTHDLINVNNKANRIGINWQWWVVVMEKGFFFHTILISILYIHSHLLTHFSFYSVQNEVSLLTFLKKEVTI